MGVPKFYRWISERYPCLSEVVREHEIPEFDNLYLDMNGIIHVCSHPNDDDPHFRITEENIFKDIFHYIEVLFRMIQPRKVFYMAVDGVAPRAKMNQQRGRRFRSAREAAENEKKALSKGEVLPTEARFDSNCITPGTEFMTKLDAQLHYFVRNKISTDPLWSDCSVIYSGHQTPGEGEHKIMEYIRYSKSQPEYDPNTRHCLYGLDADLMMLGLTSHEPHFSLLREEVRFGRQSKSSRRTPTAEETTFHLLHLSLMREYIDYEFSELKESLNFKYDLERVIDDWVFMGFLIGNDFIPHLPGLHINKGAFPVLFKTYKEVMPFLDGYLNEGGTLHLKRFEEFMKRLTEYDVEQFEETNSDLKYMHSKRGNVKKEETVDTRVERLEMFDFGNDADDEGFGVLEENTPLSSEEVRQKLAKLEISPQDEDLFFEDTDELNGEDAQFLAEFRQHKRNYYMFKMSYDNVTKDVLYEQATCYVRGLQWILNYYYNGICSWSWFYPHHYAPYISDINGFADMTMDFEFGTAFLPYEQLLAVLPPLSITLLPKAYEWLMLSSNSPLIEYYPTDFETDLNGKQQDWEAVVCIPFICEKSLLKAMKPCNERLNPAEKERNCHGPIHIFNYTSESTGEYRAPRYFPPIAINRAIVTEVWRKDWEMEPSKIIKGLLPSANLEVHFAGFPTLRHLPHGFQIQNKVVKVFDHDSRGESIILKITNQGEPSTEILDEHRELLDQEVFVGWPHLVEAKVTTVSSVNQRISVVEGNNEPKYEHLTKNEKDFWEAEVTDMRNKLLRRWGLSIGRTDYIIKAKVICGRSYAMTPNGKVTLEKNWSEKEQSFPYQTIVKDISVYNSDYKQYKTIEEYFSPKSKVFMLGEPHYGNMAEVLESDSECKGRIRISMTVPVEPDLTRIAQNFHLHGNKYHPPYVCAAKLGISTNMFSRITGTVWLLKAQELNPFAERDRSSMQMNIGLNLKNNKKMEETVGFSKRDREKSQWFYSEECVRNVETYLEKFPEVFLCMQKSDNKNELFADEIFAENYAERSKELADWLKNAPFAKAERCLFGSALVDHSSVEGVLAEVEEAAKQRAKLVKMQVKPHLLYKPNPLQGSTPLNPRVIFKLFDRVTNVREGFSVPLGATGTVIGIQEAERDCDKLYTVFFDSPFPAGLTLVGPKSAQRCYKLSWASLINRTFRQWESGAQGSNKAQFASLSNAMKQNPATYKKFSPGPGTQKNFNEQKIPSGQRPLMNDFPSNQSGRKHENQSHSLSSNYHPESRGHGNKGNSTRSERPQELEPPNPEALPKPFSFRSLLGGTNQGNDHQYTASSSSSPSTQNISFILHGNFYSNWSYIKENGIMADPRSRSIPCVSYDPESQGKRYQIHIYLSIKKLQADQIHYRVLSKGQVLCSPSFNNHIDPYYFDKVIDASNGRQIYEPNNAGPMKKPFNRNKNSNNYEYIGKGRGRRNDDDMTPMQRYDFINSQLEDYGGSQWNQESRKEVSLGDLFQSANRNSNDGLFRNLLPGGNPGVPYENAQPNSHFNSRNAPFVPTQVARKQTPTKTHPSDFSHPPPNVNAHQAGNSNVNNQNSLPDKSKAKAKPRRGRSRIAANFNT